MYLGILSPRLFEPSEAAASFSIHNYLFGMALPNTGGNLRYRPLHRHNSNGPLHRLTQIPAPASPTSTWSIAHLNSLYCDYT
ncbi:hypothetical protein AX14_010843, partial [Amanita brunnescens Koide BX004]